jgi:hypothetical protein
MFKKISKIFIEAVLFLFVLLVFLFSLGKILTFYKIMKLPQIYGRGFYSQDLIRSGIPSKHEVRRGINFEFLNRLFSFLSWIKTPNYLSPLVILACPESFPHPVSDSGVVTSFLPRMTGKRSFASLRMTFALQNLLKKLLIYIDSRPLRVWNDIWIANNQ